MSTQTFEPVQVSIFDQTYNLRSRGDGEEYVRQIARLVDERMRLVSKHLTTHDVAKVAVLAALNIADELQQVRDRYEGGARGEGARPAEGPGAREGEGVGGDEPVRRSWFENIFDAEETAAAVRGERLSSQVSAKLQAMRRPGQDGPAPGDEES
jgi:cell division protein ZapA (FtsZ GTPase activity inhibitor)